MKRAEFIEQFKRRRERSYKRAVRNGSMRLSEAVMGIAFAEDDARKLWRKLRREQNTTSGHYAIVTAK